MENKGDTLIMLRHFNETVTILITHFLHFGALKILTDDYFVLRINEIIYSKQNFKKKMDVLFTSVFSQHVFHSIIELHISK